MVRMLDCLVSYFGLDEEGRPGYRRYFCYHVVAGPGPGDGAGLAVVTTLAAHEAGERCISCEMVHTADTGGVAAALAAALRHLDAYHRADHLRKVQSDVRGPDGGSEP
jgi:hypothetical protein